MFPQLDCYLNTVLLEFDRIDEARKTELQPLTEYVQARLDAGETPRLNFICTHNSRRSHLSQIWAQVAAAFYQFPLETFSGGTEATAFNPRAVAALQRCGLQIEQLDQSENPIYEVAYAEEEFPMQAFSKVYHASPNPQADFAAVMTCTQADQGCPVVLGASKRISLPFEDPKQADGSPQESNVYDNRCRQICREIFFAFSPVIKR